MSYNVKIQRCITANWKANFETKFANWGYSDKRPLISDVYPEIVKVYSYDDFFWEFEFINEESYTMFLLKMEIL